MLEQEERALDAETTAQLAQLQQLHDAGHIDAAQLKQFRDALFAGPLPEDSESSDSDSDTEPEMGANGRLERSRPVRAYRDRNAGPILRPPVVRR